jgi:predicted CopG family antitoxin
MASSIVTSHFEELKKELDSFSDLFSQWTEQRRRVVLDDKEAYLRTLAEEQGHQLCDYQHALMVI